MKYDIFISYKRGGSSNATAAYLYDVLTKKGYSVFFDRKEIRQGQFDTQLFEHIENATDVIILLDDQSLRACFSDIKDTYKTDWFCMEVMHALKKQKRIIPLLLDGYKMPEAEQLPDEMKALSLQNAISLDIADIEDFYSKYLIGQAYLASKPRNLYLAQAKGEGVADFLFYSDGECDVFECGNLIGTINSNNDEDHPYRHPVQRCGEHRFFCRNNDTCEEQRISEIIDVNSQKYINIKWSMRQNLWELSEDDILKQKDSNILFGWGKGLFKGTSKHERNTKLAFLCLKEAAAKWNIDARNFVVDHVKDIYDLPAEERITWYEKAIEFDSPDAYTCLGHCYCDGIGVNQDYNEALRCYEKALEIRKTLYGELHPEIAESLCGIGYAYDMLNCHEEAVAWYRKAAEQGDAMAQCNLGISYDIGEGVEQDYAMAVEWYRKAAEQGNTQAQCNLGVMYEFGQGVEQDYETAVEWYRKAAEQGDAQGQCNLGVMYEFGRGVELDYEVAVEWYRKAAEQGDPRGQCNLGVLYESGQGVEQDLTAVVEWYRKAAEQGYARGQCNLGVLYESGQGVEQDYAAAVEWYRKAAEQGDARGQCNLGNMYVNGLGVEQNYEVSVEWYRKAAEQGFAQSQLNLGYMYEFAQGVKQDYAMAVEWYRKAAEQGDEQAQFNLGNMYGQGRGVEQDYETALEWYRKAAGQGFEDAYNQLAWTYHLMGKYEEALPWAEKAVAAFPDDANVIDTLAMVLQGLGRYDEALEQFELCLKLYKEQEGEEEGIKETEKKIAELKKLMGRQ